MSEAREGRARDRKSRRTDAARAKKSLAAAIRREHSRLRLRHRVLFGLGLGCASKRLIELTDTYARRHALRLVHRLLGDDLCPTHLRRIAVSRITRPLEERTHPPIDTARSARSVLHLVEGVVVGGDAGVVHLLEAHDDGVAHAGLVDGDHLAVVVEPVRLGAQDLHLRARSDDKEGRSAVSQNFVARRGAAMADRSRATSKQRGRTRRRQRKRRAPRMGTDGITSVPESGSAGAGPGALRDPRGARRRLILGGSMGGVADSAPLVSARVESSGMRRTARRFAVTRRANGLVRERDGSASRRESHLGAAGGADGLGLLLLGSLLRGSGFVLWRSGRGTRR